jgi:hypothetical protein
MKFDIWEFFENLSRKFKCRYNRTKIKGSFTWRPIKNFWSYFTHFFLEWEKFRIKVVEKIKTHILCSVTFFENRNVYEIIWKIIIGRDRPQMTIRGMLIACWISKATNSCVILIVFPLQQTCLSVRLYVLCLSCSVQYDS